MKTVPDIAPVKRDGELLNAERANQIIKAINRLAAMRVQAIRVSGMEKSELHVSEENALLALAYRDAANVLGTAATVDIITPYSGKFSFRTENGRAGSGGSIIVASDGTAQVIPPARSGGIGTRRTIASASVKVGGVQKSIASGYIKRGGVWIDFVVLNPCFDVTPEYESKTGNYTLAGFSEYTSPSVPPKKYRVQTASGEGRYCFTNGFGCVGSPLQSDRYTYTGSYIYSATTGLFLSNNQLLTFHFKNSPGSCATNWGATSTQNLPQFFDPGDYHSGFGPVETTATMKRWPGIGCDGAFSNYTGDIYADLFTEDTEDDAIARANASLGWDVSPASVAKSDSRGAGDFTGSYVYVEWRAPVSGLTAGFSYTAKARYGRRAYGSSDPFVFFAEGSVGFTAVGGSEYTPWEALPNESGYETNVISARVCLG